MYGQGKVTVELFNEKGQLEKKYEKKNYIKDLFLEAKSTVMAHSGFNFLPLSQGIQTNHVSGVMLTDYAGAPDPINDRWVVGNNIASAGTGVVSSAGVVGSYNPAQSEITTTFQRRVWDWNIAQGNGTFQSIYTVINASALGHTGSATGADGASNTQTLAPLFSIGLPFNYTSMKLYEGKLYFQEGTNLHVVEQFNFESLSTATVANARPLEYETLTLPASVHTFEIVNGEIYMQIGNNISVANLATPNVQVRQWTSPLSGAQSLCYCSERDAWFVQLATNIHMFMNNNFEGYIQPAVMTFPTANGASVSNLGMTMTRDHNAIITPNSIVSLVGNVPSIGGHLRLNENSGGTTDRIGTMVEINDMFTLVRNSLTTNNVLTVCTPSSFLSRVRLPEPITKHDYQSMRIIYEFIIPEFDLTFYDQEDNEE